MNLPASRNASAETEARSKVSTSSGDSLKTSPSDRRAGSSSGDSVCVAGIALNNVTEREALNRIEQMISSGALHYMVVVNAAKTVAARNDPILRKVITEADLVTADGMSVVWGSRLLGHPLKERVTGIDVFERMIERAEQLRLSIYLLGAAEASVNALVERFRNRFPTLRIAGYRNGYFSSETESVTAADEIRKSAADLLFIAMGSPIQEYWIASNLGRTGVKFALGVGGAFDHVSGRSRRAPLWMQRCGLEWFYRFASEPRRLWRRYLVGNSVFMWLVLKQIITGRDY